MNSNINFRDVYKLPFKFDENSLVYIRDANNNLVFNIVYRDRDEIKKILEILNDESDYKIKKDITCENATILINDVPILLIRGWGRLTGVGGFNLSDSKAIEIQNEFSDWIIKKLKGEI